MQNYLIRNNIHIPAIIYGTAWKKERTADLVEKAVQTGFRGIDTACQPKHYNEALVGDALQRLEAQGIQRKDLYLQTKFTPLSGHDPKQIPYDKHAAIEQQILQSFAVSKKNLQTHYIDTLILHSPLSPHSLLMQAWNTLEKIQQTGEVLLLGISNCYDLETLKRLYDEATIKPTIVQNRFYADTAYDTALRNWCLKHDMVYQSFWTLTANPHLLAHHILQTLAKRYNKSKEQVFFRYLTQSGIIPLTGTCSEKHMQQDLDIFDFELSKEELIKITALIGSD